MHSGCSFIIQAKVYVPGEYAVAHHLLQEFVRRYDEGELQGGGGRVWLGGRGRLGPGRGGMNVNNAVMFGIGTLILSSLLSFMFRGRLKF